MRRIRIWSRAFLDMSRHFVPPQLKTEEIDNKKNLRTRIVGLSGFLLVSFHSLSRTVQASKILLEYRQFNLVDLQHFVDT